LERAPSLGSCGHAAIAAVLRGEDWSAAVDTWLEREVSRRDLFDEEIEEYRKIAELARAIVARYLRKYSADSPSARPADQFEPVVVEAKFEVPVRGLRAKLIGYWDAIVKGRDGCLWILEHKFPQNRFRTDEDLELDGQIGVYQYAAHRLRIPVVGTIYNQLLARLPAIPKINKDSTVSRSVVYTDWETYSETVISAGGNPDDYADMREKLMSYEFFRRNYIYRPLTEIRRFARDMERCAWELARAKKHIYRSENYINCGRCGYKELCLESMKGGDVEYLIEANYEPKTKREEDSHGGEEGILFEPGR